MKKIIDFLNNNAIIASLITLIITTSIQIIFRINDRKYSEKIENKKEKKKEYENKAELLIDNNIEDDDGTVPQINLFMTDFTVKILDDKTINFYYPKDVLNNKKYKHLNFYIKNIGNADINQLDICVASQRNNMLCDIENLELFVNNNFVNYSFCYDRKIMKGKYIMIDIAYLEDSKILGMFSSELLLLFRDSYNNLYEQPFFIYQRNLYEPSKISYKYYRNCITTDLALECFEHPWMR